MTQITRRYRPTRSTRHLLAAPAAMVIAALGLTGCSEADDTPLTGGPQPGPQPEAQVYLTGADATAAVEAGDAKPYPLDVCIASREPLDAMGSPISMIYEGQEVKFCCDGCDSMFLEDPERYLARLDEGDAPQSRPHGDDHNHDHDH
ncbi:MAG: hypothetical protein WD118_09645 [Phycisphaeraceae bacterium]